MNAYGIGLVHQAKEEEVYNSFHAYAVTIVFASCTYSICGSFWLYPKIPGNHRGRGVVYPALHEQIWTKHQSPATSVSTQQQQFCLLFIPHAVFAFEGMFSTCRYFCFTNECVNGKPSPVDPVEPQQQNTDSTNEYLGLSLFLLERKRNKSLNTFNLSASNFAWWNFKSFSSSIQQLLFCLTLIHPNLRRPTHSSAVLYPNINNTLLPTQNTWGSKNRRKRKEKNAYMESPKPTFCVISLWWLPEKFLVSSWGDLHELIRLLKMRRICAPLPSNQQKRTRGRSQTNQNKNVAEARRGTSTQNNSNKNLAF